MARPPILSLNAVSLTFGGNPLFSDVDLAIAEGDRLCLVGRNGSGKSTLLKGIAGQVTFDSGDRFVQPGAKISYLPQEPDLSGFETLGDFAAAELGPDERYRAESAMQALSVNAEAGASTASGGEKRRAALARLLAGEPDVMLLDEPTNHLDIACIEWLEETLKATRAGFVLISHDRAFLSALSRGTLWIDRGTLRRQERGFTAFEDWRDKTFDEEDTALHKLDRKIKREEHWIIHGVSGRRKRNVRRVGELAQLREQKQTHIRRAGPAAMALESSGGSGKLVIEAESIAKQFGDRVIVEDFSTKVMRGDRLALVGPNGAGKTTLLNMLIGKLTPDSGTVKLGTKLEVALLDQSRELDETKSLWETLTEDKLLGVKGSNDQILVRGKPKHVVGYLKEFLFDERQARGPVSALSGGERARLLLARIMAQPSNLLVLDEPTNDLDIETLDLLQELLDDYDGTLLLVSHDRDFIDRIATSTIAMEGDGSVQEYPGGWSDYQRQRGNCAQAKNTPKDTAKDTTAKQAPKDQPKSESRAAKKLSFKEAHRLESLPGEMEKLEAEIAKLEEFLADPELYANEPAKFAKATEALTERQDSLAAAEEEWLLLEERKEALEG